MIPQNCLTLLNIFITTSWYAFGMYYAVCFYRWTSLFFNIYVPHHYEAHVSVNRDSSLSSISHCKSTIGNVNWIWTCSDRRIALRRDSNKKNWKCWRWRAQVCYADEVNKYEMSMILGGCRLREGTTYILVYCSTS